MIRTKRTPGLKMIENINITPFTDVCLVLLIIFMVTATALTREKNLDINLPQAATADALLPASVTVRIASDQQIYLNDQPTSFLQLPQQLRSIREDSGTRLLVVKADEGIPYRLVITTIDLARQAGLDSIALATREPDTTGLTPSP